MEVRGSIPGSRILGHLTTARGEVDRSTRGLKVSVADLLVTIPVFSTRGHKIRGQSR